MDSDEDVCSPLLVKLDDNSYTPLVNIQSESSVSGFEVVHSQPAADVNGNNGDAGLSAESARWWDFNYREAAIYLREGKDNDQFNTHPHRRVDIPAYTFAHSTWFYVFSCCASMLLLALAIVEDPPVDIHGFKFPLYAHAVVELVALAVISVELLVKVRWLGLRRFICHRRTLFKTIILLVMFAEAITVIIRQQNHIRATRALRPVLLLDSPYCRGVRRFIRQILQSLPAVIDMLVLVLFFILLFSMLGFYLFCNVPGDMFFKDFLSSFNSLFILLTTANFPDVMMPAYSYNGASPVFFIVYVTIELFLFMNLFLAVVYSAFLRMEKEKLHRLLMHRREACSLAFKLLVTAANPDVVTARHFAGCMHYYRPTLSKRDIYLAFKLLNTDRTGKLTREEFMAVYDVMLLKWNRRKSDECWSAEFRRPFNRMFHYVYVLVSSKCFGYFIYVIIMLNFVWIVIDTVHISVEKPKSGNATFDWLDIEHPYAWCSIMFVAVYIVEAMLKILGFGPTVYFSSGWNSFDFIVTLIALIGVLLELVDHNFFYLVILRPLRVLRLFKLKRRLRDAFGTLFILFSRMMSLGVAFLMLYYSFAIIGMEIFAPYTSQLKNCCKNTSVELYYVYNETTGVYGYYYINSFENIIVSGVTLFELTVVNNWWVIMEGFASVVSAWARIYFMVFYLIIMVVMTVVVAFIIEAFMFRIQYRDTMKGQDMEDDAIRKVDIPLSTAELQMCCGDGELSGRFITQQRDDETSQCSSYSTTYRSLQQTSEIDQSESTDTLYVWYQGVARLGRYDFSLKMYKDSVEEWIAQSEHTCSCQNHTEPLIDLNAETTVVASSYLVYCGSS